MAEETKSYLDLTRRCFSKKELTDAAHAWMRKQRADGFEPDQDRYHAKLGMLFDFVTDLIPKDL